MKGFTFSCRKSRICKKDQISQRDFKQNFSRDFKVGKQDIAKEIFFTIIWKLVREDKKAVQNGVQTKSASDRFTRISFEFAKKMVDLDLLNRLQRFVLDYCIVLAIGAQYQRWYVFKEASHFFVQHYGGIERKINWIYVSSYTMNAATPIEVHRYIYLSIRVFYVNIQLIWNCTIYTNIHLF